MKSLHLPSHVPCREVQWWHNTDFPWSTASQWFSAWNKLPDIASSCWHGGELDNWPVSYKEDTFFEKCKSSSTQCQQLDNWSQLSHVWWRVIHVLGKKQRHVCWLSLGLGFYYTIAHLGKIQLWAQQYRFLFCPIRVFYLSNVTDMIQYGLWSLYPQMTRNPARKNRRSN